MDVVSLIDSLAKMTTVALELWSYNKKQKYIEEFNEIQKRLDHEQRKELSKQDFNLIDHLYRDLVLFSRKLHQRITTDGAKDVEVRN